MEGILIFIQLALAILIIVSFWKIFTKAGQHGWAAIVPFYNLYILLKIAGKPGWWMLLYIIPLFNLIISVIVCIEIARAFGKGEGFGVGLFFLGFIFYPILAFGDAEFTG